MSVPAAHHGNPCGYPHVANEHPSLDLVSSSQELLSGIHGASAKQGPWGQPADWAWYGLQIVLQQQGTLIFVQESVRSQHPSLILCIKDLIGET